MFGFLSLVVRLAGVLAFFAMVMFWVPGFRGAAVCAGASSFGIVFVIKLLAA